MKKKFKINLWNHVNMENINNELDNATEKNDHIATDISYKCLGITRDGTLTLEAYYIPEDY